MNQITELDFSSIYDELNITYNNTEGFTFDPDTQPCADLPNTNAVMIGVCVFYVIVFMLAIPGNLVVGFVIGLSRQPLSPSDLYLLHLAIADILLAITLPFWATSVTQGWVFGDLVCKVVSILQELSFYASVLFLACISVDRYLVIVCAMEASKVNRKLVSWCVCAVVWFAGGLLSLTGLLNSATLSNTTQQAVCSLHYDAGSVAKWRLATRGLSHTLGFVVPLVVMLVCYGVTVRRLMRTRVGFQRQRAMRVIIAVVVAFLLCWTPYNLALMADTFLTAKVVAYECATRRAISAAKFATQSLGLLHSCVNPVLYAFVGAKFRQRLELAVKKTGLMTDARASRPTSRSSLSSEFTSMIM